MSSTPPNRILSPEEIALRAGGTDPELRLMPEAGVFAERALRLRQLAANHSLRDYLMLMAVICEAQHRRLPDFPPVALPTPQQVQAASEARQPLLSIVSVMILMRSSVRSCSVRPPAPLAFWLPPWNGD